MSCAKRERKELVRLLCGSSIGEAAARRPRGCPYHGCPAGPAPPRAPPPDRLARAPSWPRAPRGHGRSWGGGAQSAAANSGLPPCFYPVFVFFFARCHCRARFRDSRRGPLSNGVVDGALDAGAVGVGRDRRLPVCYLRGLVITGSVMAGRSPSAGPWTGAVGRGHRPCRHKAGKGCADAHPRTGCVTACRGVAWRVLPNLQSAELLSHWIPPGYGLSRAAPCRPGSPPWGPL